MDFASYGLPPSRSVEVLEADNTSAPPALYYPRSQVQPPIPGSASATVSWPFVAFLHEQSPVAQSTSQAALGLSSSPSDVRGLVPAQPSIFSLSTQQQQSTIISATTSSSPQAQLVSIAPSQSYVAPSANPGAMSLAATPAGRHGYLIPARPPPSASQGCDVNLMQSSSHPPVVFERYGIERSLPAASSRSRTVSFVNCTGQVASHGSIAPGQTARGTSSRHARFSAQAAATASTATSVSPALTYVSGHQQIEEVKSARQRFLASQHDPAAAATVAEANRRNSRRSLCPKPLICDVEPVRSAIGEYLDQSFTGQNGFPSFTNRQATFPPPSHPATRHAPKPSPPRRHTYYEEPSYPDTVLPTDIFAYPTQYTSLQEWLSETDGGLCASGSPTSEQTLPPEVTFPDLELLEAEIGVEEAFLSDDAYFSLDGVRAVVHLDGDAVMEDQDENEDIDAEGSTEDDSEMISDLEEPEDDDNVYEVVAGGGPAVEEVPEPSSAAQLQEQEQEHVQSSPENATKALPCPSKRSSTADTLATETAGSTDDASSRHSTPLDASPTTAPSISSRDGSVLSSADGEGETEDGEGETEDEYADSPGEEEDESSATTTSRASSPASSVSIPLSYHCRAASRASPHQEPESDLDEVIPPSPPRSPSLTPPPKSFTNRRTRAPYQRTRPPVQPLEGIPDGSAEYSEVTKLYKCTCHGRTYRRKGDLQRHLSEGSLPEVCNGCGRGFPRKDPRIRHWNQNPLCEAIHHVKNIHDVKEASRWNKRWTSAMFAGKAAAMERLVDEQLAVLASGADPINRVEEIIPRPRTRTRVTPAARRPRHKKAVKRRFDSDEETEDDFDDGELEEEDSFHPSKVVALAIVRDDLVSESRKASLRRKGQEL